MSWPPSTPHRRREVAENFAEVPVVLHTAHTLRMLAHFLDHG